MIEERLDRERRDELIDASNRSLQRARDAEKRFRMACDLLRKTIICMGGGDTQTQVRLFLEQHKDMLR